MEQTMSFVGLNLNLNNVHVFKSQIHKRHYCF